MTLPCDNEGDWPFTDGWPVPAGVTRSFAPTVNPGDDDEDDEDDEDDGKEGGNIDPDEDEGYGDEDDDDDDEEEPLRVAPAPESRPRLLRRSKPHSHGFGATRLPQRAERPVRILSRRRHTARPQSSAPFRVACPHASVPRHR